MVEYAIDKLNELWIKQTIEDKKRGKIAYVKKADAIKDLINLLKKEEIWKEET